MAPNEGDNKVACDLIMKGSTDFGIDAYDPMRFGGPTDEAALEAAAGDIARGAAPA